MGLRVVSYAAALVGITLGSVHGLGFIASFNGPAVSGLNNYRASDAEGSSAQGGPVVLFIADGLRLDGVPLLDLEPATLNSANFCTLHAEYPSFSKTGYVALLTGASPAVSGVQTNAFSGSVQIEHLPGWAQRRDIPAHIVTDGLDWWDVLFDRRWRSRHFGAEGFDEALAAALSVVRSWQEQPGLLVVHMVRGDEMGHDYGAESVQYAEAMAYVGRRLSTALERLNGSATVIMVSDHGHLDRGGHGGAEPDVIQTPMLAWGLKDNPVPKGCIRRLVDVASTVSGLLGLPPSAGNIGRPMPEFVNAEFRGRVEVQRTRLSTRLGADLASAPTDLLSGVREPSIWGAFIASLGVSLVVFLGFRVVFSGWPTWQQLATVSLTPLAFACAYAAVEPALSFSAVWVQAQWVLRLGVIYVVSSLFSESLAISLKLGARAPKKQVEADVCLRVAVTLILYASALGWHGSWSGGPELGHPTAAFMVVIADVLLVATGVEGLVRLAWNDVAKPSRHRSKHT